MELARRGFAGSVRVVVAEQSCSRVWNLPMIIDDRSMKFGILFVIRNK